MLLRELDAYFQALLDIPGFAAADDSLNGIQVGPADREIRRVAFAVDACLESFSRAQAAGADILFVHHGLFWGKPLAITGNHFKRINFLLNNDLALYACHLPLDAHPELGNNAVLASLLKLEKREPFGIYHGRAIGFKGSFNQPISLSQAIERVLPDGSTPLAVYPFGPREIRSAACISGGAPWESLQALDAGIDLYVTGEASHSIYHSVEEGGLSVICAGHYASEVWGLKALSERLSRDCGLSTIFIHLPTGQ